ADGAPVDYLFCDNESNAAKLWGDDSRTGFWKDAFHERVVNGKTAAVNPDRQGTKSGVWYSLQIAGRGSHTLRLRLSKNAVAAPFANFDSLFAARIQEADDFYGELQQGMDSADARAVQRQAFAGMIWSKQFFNFDIPVWLAGDSGQPA